MELITSVANASVAFLESLKPGANFTPLQVYSREISRRMLDTIKIREFYPTPGVLYWILKSGIGWGGVFSFFSFFFFFLIKK